MSLKRIFDDHEFEELRRAALPVLFAKVSEEELKERGVILFGLGESGRRILTCLIQAGFRPEWLVDNNPALQGTKIAGLDVRGAESLSQAGRRYVLLASGPSVPAMVDDCHKFKADNWILPAALADFIYTPGEIGISLDELEVLEEVEECYYLLADDESKSVFKDFIRFHTCFDTRLFLHYDEDIYFPKLLKEQIDYSCFVDAGAFNGDTLKQWLQHTSFGVYHGFEPQYFAFRELADYVFGLPKKESVEINIYNKALCSLGEGRTLPIPLDGVASTLSLARNIEKSSDMSTVPVMRLDDLLSSHPPITRMPTIIKVDVEGFELEVLKGAQGVIVDKTNFAVCVYHKKLDIFTLPLYIKHVQPKAKLYLRHHLKTFGDTVCYAIV